MPQAEKQEGSEVIFRDIPKNQSEIIRISLSEFNGHQGINIRVYFRSKETQNLLPSRKGIWIPIKVASDVSTALVEALEQLAKEGSE